LIASRREVLSTGRLSKQPGTNVTGTHREYKAETNIAGCHGVPLIPIATGKTNSEDVS
jgi:hypothetical protein